MSVNVVPTLKKSALKDEKVFFPAKVVTSKDFSAETEVFSIYAGKIGIDFVTGDEGSILTVKDETLQNGYYKIISTSDSIELHAGDSNGMHYAFATLLQLMEKGENAGFYFPVGEIEDWGDTLYRGMMVDLARDWHDFKYLLKYVDMCYFYKVSVLHLHFTDDQSYTLPSDIYPKLSTPEKHYSKEEIALLVKYAQDRGVELMPEIDVPGHCTSFIEAYSEIFGNMGIICQHFDSMQAMRELFCELCDMFPNSKYIHIGGDEAAISKWTECSKCRKYIASKGIDVDIEDQKLLAEQMLANFVEEMGQAVLSKGRKPIAWEGFAKEVNHMVSKDIIIMSWENYYQLTPQLLEGGFEVINCSWKPMYIVAPIIQRSLDSVYDWSVYKWMPVHPQSPYIRTGVEIEPTDKVLGGQLLAWGDRIVSDYPSVEEGVADEFRMLKERIPYLGQNTWNIKKSLSYEEFSSLAQEPGDRLSIILDY